MCNLFVKMRVICEDESFSVEKNIYLYDLREKMHLLGCLYHINFLSLQPFLLHGKSLYMWYIVCSFFFYTGIQFLLHEYTLTLNIFVLKNLTIYKYLITKIRKYRKVQKSTESLLSLTQLYYCSAND